MSFTMRSTGEIPSNSTRVVIGDTMGELMLLYGIADRRSSAAARLNVAGITRSNPPPMLFRC